MPTKKEVKVKETKPLFRMELDVNGKTIKGTGETFGSAIDSLKPLIIKSNGFLRVETDGKKTSRLLNIGEMRRLFNGTNIVKQVLEARLLKLLK